MTPLKRIEGRAYPLGRDNVDTDLIIPARHLKTLTRAGLGRHLFEALRQGGGSMFDDPALKGAPILIAGRNFGCGSSREHAAWALSDFGIKAVIAISFSDIFAGNAFKNGIAAIELPEEAIEALLGRGQSGILVDLISCRVEASGDTFSFDMDPFRRKCLVEGLDEIALTLGHAPMIDAFEAASPSCLRSWPAASHAFGRTSRSVHAAADR